MVLQKTVPRDAPVRYAPATAPASVDTPLTQRLSLLPPAGPCSNRTWQSAGALAGRHSIQHTSLLSFAACRSYTCSLHRYGVWLSAAFGAHGFYLPACSHAKTATIAFLYSQDSAPSQLPTFPFFLSVFRSELFVCPAQIRFRTPRMLLHAPLTGGAPPAPLMQSHGGASGEHGFRAGVENLVQKSSLETEQKNSPRTSPLSPRRKLFRPWALPRLVTAHEMSRWVPTMRRLGGVQIGRGGLGFPLSPRIYL